MVSLWHIQHFRTFSTSWPSSSLWRSLVDWWSRQIAWQRCMTSTWNLPTRMMLLLGHWLAVHQSIHEWKHLKWWLENCDPSQVSPSFIDTACTMGNRASCSAKGVQLTTCQKFQLQKYGSVYQLLLPFLKMLARCWTIDSFQSCSWKPTNQRRRRSVIGQSTKSSYRKDETVMASDGCSQECCLDSTMGCSIWYHPPDYFQVWFSHKLILKVFLP